MNYAVLRLALYGAALVTGAVVAVVAQVQGDDAALAVALGWIATNVLAAVNVPRGSANGDHAAE